MKFYLPFSTRHYRDPGELTLIRIFTLLRLLSVLPGSYLLAPEQGGLRVEKVSSYLPEFGKVSINFSGCLRE